MKSVTRVFLIIVISCVSQLAISQVTQAGSDAQQGGKEWRGVKDRTGSFYINWGYNRDYYRDTDIHFKGEGFDFDIYGVSAHDIPEKFSTSVYFHPLKLTIPQFDFRLGYFLNDKMSLSFGWDHMKYRITRNQLLTIDGYIDPELSPVYGRDYDNELIYLDTKLLMFEHSDGLNFVRAGIERQTPFWESSNRRLRFENMIGLSVGAVVPWTDVTFLDKRYKNWIHVAGWGTSAVMALKAHYGNNLYLQYRMQVGYLRMGNILMQDEADSRADHDIKFTELSVSLGYNFWLNNNKKRGAK